MKPHALKSISLRSLRLVGTSRWEKAEGLWFGYSAVPQPTEQVLCAGEAVTALFLLPNSVITPISSLWRRACRIATTTTGMMASSDFSNVLVATEPFPLTGSPKNPAGKKWAVWNSSSGFSCCPFTSSVLGVTESCPETGTSVLPAEWCGKSVGLVLDPPHAVQQTHHGGPHLPSSSFSTCGLFKWERDGMLKVSVRHQFLSTSALWLLSQALLQRP